MLDRPGVGIFMAAAFSFSLAVTAVVTDQLNLMPGGPLTALQRMVLVTLVACIVLLFTAVVLLAMAGVAIPALIAICGALAFLSGMLAVGVTVVPRREASDTEKS